MASEKSFEIEPGNSFVRYFSCQLQVSVLLRQNIQVDKERNSPAVLIRVGAVRGVLFGVSLVPAFFQRFSRRKLLLNPVGEALCRGQEDFLLRQVVGVGIGLRGTECIFIAQDVRVPEVEVAARLLFGIISKTFPIQSESIIIEPKTAASAFNNLFFNSQLSIDN